MKKFSQLTLMVILFSAIIPSCIPSPQENNYNDFRFLEFDILQMQAGYEKGEFTAEDVVKAYISRIQSVDASGPAINSMIVVNNH